MIKFAPAVAAGLCILLTAPAGEAGPGNGRGQGAWTEDGFCPPGLARRDPACVPPGQARHLDRDDETREERRATRRAAREAERAEARALAIEAERLAERERRRAERLAALRAERRDDRIAVATPVREIEVAPGGDRSRTAEVLAALLSPTAASPTPAPGPADSSSSSGGVDLADALRIAAESGLVGF